MQKLHVFELSLPTPMSLERASAAENMTAKITAFDNHPAHAAPDLPPVESTCMGTHVTSSPGARTQSPPPALAPWWAPVTKGGKKPSPIIFLIPGGRLDRT